MKPLPVKIGHVYLLVSAALAAGIFLLDLSTPLGVAGEALYVLPVLVMMWMPRRQFVLVVAAASTVLCILGFFYSPPGGIVWMAVTNRVLSLVAIWGTTFLALLLKRAAQDKERLILQLQEALAQVKTLRGLLPICSSCKKIRDDRGYWNQLETYIGAHSDAQFTHGICPECAQKLYPDYYENK